MTTTATASPGNVVDTVNVRWARTEQELPLSGWRIVTVRRSVGAAMEVYDVDGDLVCVFTDSALDREVLAGAWRGRSRDGRPWVLAVGRSADVPFAIRFVDRRRRGAGTRLDVDCGVAGHRLWVAEAATSATHVRIGVTGRSYRLQPAK